MNTSFEYTEKQGEWIYSCGGKTRHKRVEFYGFGGETLAKYIIEKRCAFRYFFGIIKYEYYSEAVVCSNYHIVKIIT